MINNVYDIYNATLEADKPIADAITAAILAELQVSITNNISTFDFDLGPYTSALPLIQQNRINDRVLCVLRAAGIHCRMKVAPLTPQDPVCDTPYSGAWFNGLYGGFNLITITWYTRNVQEYQKCYV